MSGEHRSIGEVLELLREEFPEVTISKIRFLESQGLIAPERTPSGYRKFYEADIERLRWILEQQRDHYLPLKVIRSRLVEFEERRATEAVDGPDGPGSSANASGSGTGSASSEGSGGSEVSGSTAVPAGSSGSDEPSARSGSAGDGGGVDRGPPAPEPPPRRATGGPAPVPAGDAVIPEGGGSHDDEGGSRASSVESGAAVSRDELARLTGLDEATLAELEGFGLLPRPAAVGGEELYDEEAVVVGRLARGFLRHGVEARHLRMFKTAAEREAVFVSQLVTPLLRQRNPDARRSARETVSELARLGGGMRAALLRVALRQALQE